MHKSGFVSIIGRPNVGKSSLMNNIIGNHLSIISSTSQTTRNSIKGIYNDDECQIVFIDTPGIHKPKNSLGEFMNKQSLNSLNDADCVMWIVDASMEFGSGDQFVLHILEDIKTPVVLIFNKMDLVDKESVSFKENESKFINSYSFNKIEYISCLNNQNIDVLVSDLKEILPIGPAYYDKDLISDSIERFIISEIIREKIIYLTKEEVPHSVAVEIEEMKENEENVEIYACIVCERESQKKILVGKQASMIKKIKQYSKRDIQKLLACPVYLELFVKVDNDWRNNKASLSRLGYKNK